MKARCHCHSPAQGGNPARRGLASLRWLLPGAVLALMPKCPACLAAYIALATGVGLSFPVASALRISLIVVSAASLVLLAAQYFRKRRRESSE